MTRYYFKITVPQCTGESRNENAVLSDAFCHFLHPFIIRYLERMVFERNQL